MLEKYWENIRICQIKLLENLRGKFFYTFFNISCKILSICKIVPICF